MWARMDIRAGIGTRVGQICTYTSPYPIEKIRYYPYSYHSMRGFPIKTWMNFDSTHKDEFICHP